MLAQFPAVVTAHAVATDTTITTVADTGSDVDPSMDETVVSPDDRPGAPEDGGDALDDAARLAQFPGGDALHAATESRQRAEILDRVNGARALATVDVLTGGLATVVREELLAKHADKATPSNVAEILDQVIERIDDHNLAITCTVPIFRRRPGFIKRTYNDAWENGPSACTTARRFHTVVQGDPYAELAGIENRTVGAETICSRYARLADLNAPELVLVHERTQARKRTLAALEDLHVARFVWRILKDPALKTHLDTQLQAWEQAERRDLRTEAQSKGIAPKRRPPLDRCIAQHKDYIDERLYLAALFGPAAYRNDVKSLLRAVVEGLTATDFNTFAQAYHDEIQAVTAQLEDGKEGLIDNLLRGLENDPEITYPFPADWVRQRLLRRRLVAMDPVVAVEANQAGRYTAHDGDIGINTRGWLDGNESTIFHEFFHALAGETWTDAGTGFPVNTRSGLTFTPPDMRQFVLGYHLNYPYDWRRPPANRLRWLNEAMTEFLTLRACRYSANPPATQQDSDVYPSERRMLQRLLNAGIPLQLFVDAYFENVMSGGPNKRLPAYRRLSAAIRERFDDTWLVRMDTLYQKGRGVFIKLANPGEP